MQMMERQLKHLVRLADDLLDVGRINSGKLHLRTRRAPVSDMLETAIESSRGLVESRGHRLEIDIRIRDLVVEADADRLVQVFSNLLTNAAKYTQPGGCIRVSADREGQHAVVSVTDHGIGIPAESLVSIFEMFSQLGGNPWSTEGGLGIGLALVNRTGSDAFRDSSAPRARGRAKGVRSRSACRCCRPWSQWCLVPCLSLLKCLGHRDLAHQGVDLTPSSTHQPSSRCLIPCPGPPRQTAATRLPAVQQDSRKRFSSRIGKVAIAHSRRVKNRVSDGRVGSDVTELPHTFDARPD